MTQERLNQLNIEIPIIGDKELNKIATSSRDFDELTALLVAVEQKVEQLKLAQASSYRSSVINYRIKYYEYQRQRLAKRLAFVLSKREQAKKKKKLTRAQARIHEQDQLKTLVRTILTERGQYQKQKSAHTQDFIATHRIVIDDPVADQAMESIKAQLLAGKSLEEIQEESKAKEKAEIKSLIQSLYRPGDVETAEPALDIVDAFADGDLG